MEWPKTFNELTGIKNPTIIHLMKKVTMRENKTVLLSQETL